MELKFQFEYRAESYFGKIYRPYAKVSLKSQNENLWIDEWMIVDTGADFTTLPRYLSSALGVNIENDCLVGSTSGVGGEQTIYILKKRVETRVGNFLRNVPIAFFDNNQVPSLMGRLGFIDTFDLEFLKSLEVVFR